MNITPGNYILRNGWKARVLCDDAPGSKPCVGYVIHPNDGASAEDWTLQGNLHPSSLECQLDILHADYEPDWTKAPDWAQWYAVDQIGYAFWWRDEPTPSRDRWSGSGAIRSEAVYSSWSGPVDMTNINWKETMRKRP